MCYIQQTLPPETVLNIIRQVEADRGAQWVKLVPHYDSAYYLISITEPSPLLRVCSRTREVMVFHNLALKLTAKRNERPTLITSFNFEQDTLYLDLELQTYCEGLSLNRLLGAIPLQQIRQVQNLAIAFYPSRNPSNLERSAEQFKADLDQFSNLKSLTVVRQGYDVYAGALSSIIPEAELGNNPSLYTEDLGAGIGQELTFWVADIQSHVLSRNITVNVVTG
jgi:hypothetical protein